jgi:hypothetical protein
MLTRDGDGLGLRLFQGQANATSLVVAMVSVCAICTTFFLFSQERQQTPWLEEENP